MTQLPRITLITVVRNGAAHIERCLQSVAAQDYPNLHYIVLDGASTDGTQAIIERYRHFISVYHSRPDSGAYDATLQAYRMAEGDIVGLLHADDWLEGGALHTLAQMHAQTPDAGMFCFGMLEHKQQADGSLVPTRLFTDPPGDAFGLEDGFYCQGVNRYYSLRILREEGYFRLERYPNLADREFYVRLGIRGIKKAHTGKVLYHFRLHGASNSTGGGAAKTALWLAETARIAEEYLRRLPPDTPAPVRASFERWYCFNRLREVRFRLAACAPGKAFAAAALALWRYPRPMLRALVGWRMPAPYRPRKP